MPSSTMWASVSMIGPRVPGTSCRRCCGGRLSQKSISLIVAQAWCAKASWSIDVAVIADSSLASDAL
ncbi:MAG: hypothetical protein ACXVPL_06695, partial [Actinomycetota bacterium]